MNDHGGNTMNTRFVRGLTLFLVAMLAAPFSAHATITGNVNVNIQLQDARTSGPESATQVINQTYSWAVSNGTGAGLFNQCWPSTRTLTTGANEDIDLAGSLTNIFGATVFTAVKLISISAAAANTTLLTVTRPAAGIPFLLTAADAFVLGGGDFFVITRRSAAGVAVTATTADLINVANAAGASATYTIIVCGLS